MLAVLGICSTRSASVVSCLCVNNLFSSSDIRAPTLPQGIEPFGPVLPAELVRFRRTPSAPRFMHGVVGRGGRLSAGITPPVEFVTVPVLLCSKGASCSGGSDGDWPARCGPAIPRLIQGVLGRGGTAVPVICSVDVTTSLRGTGTLATCEVLAGAAEGLLSLLTRSDNAAWILLKGIGEGAELIDSLGHMFS